MEKEIRITLSARKWFALTHAGIRKHARRKAFLAGDLTTQIDDQLKKEITASQYEKLKTEWVALAHLFPAQIEKKKTAGH